MPVDKRPLHICRQQGPDAASATVSSVTPDATHAADTPHTTDTSHTERDIRAKGLHEFRVHKGLPEAHIPAEPVPEA
jgi:hypothetical protein